MGFISYSESMDLAQEIIDEIPQNPVKRRVIAGLVVDLGKELIDAANEYDLSMDDLHSTIDLVDIGMMLTIARAEGKLIP